MSYTYFVHGQDWWISAAQMRWFAAHASKHPVYRAEESAGLWPGHTAFVVAPGPSLAAFPADALAGRLTVALNSAMFWTRTRYVCVAETTWINWFRRQPDVYPQYQEQLATQDMLLGGRTGIWWQMRGMPFRRIYFMRHQEEKRIPAAVSGATILNALAQCAYMGCARAVLIGVDLSREEKPYAEGLAHNPDAEADDLRIPG